MVGHEVRSKKPLDHWIWNFGTELHETKMCQCPKNVAFIYSDNDNTPNKIRLAERSLKLCDPNCIVLSVLNFKKKKRKTSEIWCQKSEPK